MFKTIKINYENSVHKISFNPVLLTSTHLPTKLLHMSYVKSFLCRAASIWNSPYVMLSFFLKIPPS